MSTITSGELMSTITNGYIYPMASSTTGGALETERNIRSLMACMFNKSSTRSDVDFVVVDDNLKPLGNTNGTSPYDSNTRKLKFRVTSGVGQTNGYYVKSNSTISFEETLTDPQSGRLYVVVGVAFVNNQLADSLNVYVYTETDYNTQVQKAQNMGLNDAGIVLGYIDVIVNGGVVTATYTPNPAKSTCLDVNKLGSGQMSLGDFLYDKIKRLYELTLDNGSFKLGTVVDNSIDSGFDPIPGGNNHDFSKISKYKFETQLIKNSNTQATLKIGFSNLSSADLTTTNGVTDDGRLITCTINIDDTTKEFTSVGSINLFGTSMQISALSGGVRTLTLNMPVSITGSNTLSIGGTEVSGSATGLSINGNVNVSNELRADKVYGAVWE